MDDAALKKIKDVLDDDLALVGPKVGILFGEALFKAFREKGWITLEMFGLLGTTLFAERLPAYNGRYAHRTWDIGEYDYRVGKDVDQAGEA